MSVLIPDMEMPNRCGYCQFADAFDCGVDGKFIPTHDARRTDCPLVPIPPHGRLIDADVLCDKLEKAAKIKPHLEAALNAAISLALVAKTIIPADKESEEWNNS